MGLPAADAELLLCPRSCSVQSTPCLAHHSRTITVVLPHAVSPAQGADSPILLPLTVTVLCCAASPACARQEVSGAGLVHGPGPLSVPISSSLGFPVCCSALTAGCPVCHSGAPHSNGCECTALSPCPWDTVGQGLGTAVGSLAPSSTQLQTCSLCGAAVSHQPVPHSQQPWPGPQGQGVSHGGVFTRHLSAWGTHL